MKVLTVITVVIMPINLIASIYGMNFVFPEQKWPAYAGYAWALGLMVVVGVGMYAFVKSRKWL
jgi:magnesium transporter